MGKPGSASRAAAAAALNTNLWLASNPSKRWTEVLWLSYSLFWILWVLVILVPFQLYEHMAHTGYLLVGLATAVPLIVLPLILPNKRARTGSRQIALGSAAHTVVCRAGGGEAGPETGSRSAGNAQQHATSATRTLGSMHMHVRADDSTPRVFPWRVAPPGTSTLAHTPGDAGRSVAASRPPLCVPDTLQHGGRSRRAPDERRCVPPVRVRAVSCGGASATDACPPFGLGLCRAAVRAQRTRAPRLGWGCVVRRYERNGRVSPVWVGAVSCGGASATDVCRHPSQSPGNPGWSTTTKPANTLHTQNLGHRLSCTTRDTQPHRTVSAAPKHSPHCWCRPLLTHAGRPGEAFQPAVLGEVPRARWCIATEPQRMRAGDRTRHPSLHRAAKREKRAPTGHSVDRRSRMALSDGAAVRASLVHDQVVCSRSGRGSGGTRCVSSGRGAGVGGAAEWAQQQGRRGHTRGKTHKPPPAGASRASLRSASRERVGREGRVVTSWPATPSRGGRVTSHEVMMSGAHTSPTPPVGPPDGGSNNT
ncbi:MAG: hypothetical protein WDW38_011127 [Sanguina aurantia]